LSCFLFICSRDNFTKLCFLYGNCISWCHIAKTRGRVTFILFYKKKKTAVNKTLLHSRNVTLIEIKNR
jgi:hypothetical protein